MYNWEVVVKVVKDAGRDWGVGKAGWRGARVGQMVS